MTVFDYVVLAVVALSMMVSVWRGVVREVFSLVGWIAAMILAIAYCGPLAQLLPASIDGPAVRVIVAFLIILFGTTILSTLIGWLLAKLIHGVGLGFIDRALGAVFGLARGLLVVLVVVLVAGLTHLPRNDWWQNALFSAPLETAVLLLKPHLPGELAKRIDYRSEPARKQQA